MSQARISLSIGWYPINPQPQNPQMISKLTAKAVLKKQQIKNLTNNLTTKIGSDRLPIILIETSTNLKQFSLPSSKIQTTNDHHYIMMDKQEDQQFRQMLKKIEKVFQNMNTLDNSVFLTVEFYDFDSIFTKVVKEQQNIGMALTQRIKINLSVNTDKECYKRFGQLAGKVSKQFADSPIMALLPLLDTIQGDIQMQSPSSLQQENQQKLPQYKIKVDVAGLIDESELQYAKMPLKKGLKVKEMSNIYLSFGNLGIIHVQLETRYMAFLFAFF